MPHLVTRAAATVLCRHLIACMLHGLWTHLVVMLEFACTFSKRMRLLMKGGEVSGEERRLTLLAALTLPLRACRDESNPKPKQRLSAPSHIILNAIKWKRKDEECVTALHAAGPQLLQCYHQLQVTVMLLYC